MRLCAGVQTEAAESQINPFDGLKACVVSTSLCLCLPFYYAYACRLVDMVLVTAEVDVMTPINGQSVSVTRLLPA